MVREHGYAREGFYLSLKVEYGNLLHERGAT